MNNRREYEDKYISEGFNYIGGTDEAGRGPLVGPVVASCVVFPKDYVNEEINDSKKLTEKKREKLYDIIMKDAIAIGIGIVSNKEIDEINILEASRKAMILAYEEACKKIKIDVLLTDAMKIDSLDIKVEPIIKGDQKSISIGAASIIAKVTRDRILYELDRKYPMYELKKHKGYPTKRHIELINKYGVTEDYRKTYGPVKKVLEQGNK